MADALMTKAYAAADLFPWPRGTEEVAVCASHDPELWFPRDQYDYDEAVALCETCPLIDLCRAVAVARGEQGIWGGVLFDKDGRALDRLPVLGRPKKRAA